MGDEERYELVKALFSKGKFKIKKENPPTAFRFSWKGRVVDVWNAKRYLLDTKGDEKFTVDTEGYVKFKHDRGSASVEWDVRSSKKLEKVLKESTMKFTLRTAYLSIILVVLAVVVLVVPILLRDLQHGVGYLAIAIIFLWIPPLTTYTILEYYQSNLMHLGMQNVAKKIEKMFKTNSEKLKDIRIQRYEK
jgi:hypothetical protein